MVDRDDKYDKIKRQEDRFRSRFACVAVCLLTFMSIHFYFHQEKDRQYLQLLNRGGGDGLRPATDKKKDNAAKVAPFAVVKEEVKEATKATVQTPNGPHGDDEVDEAALEKEVEKLDAEVRRIKASLPAGHFTETDPKAVDATKRLQDATRKLLHKRYGPNEPYHVRVELEFQPTIPDFEKDGGKDGMILIEMAPSKLQPHSIFTYMEVSRKYEGGGFHRIAGHVLQVMVKNTGVQHLAFQEYSPEWPHKKGTVGYAGRPSGPAWYVSLINNVRNHGPGSQQKANPHEADSCFGKVIEGFDTYVQRIRKVPGEGFINDHKKWVLINKMQIMVPGPNGEYVDWEPKQ